MISWLNFLWFKNVLKIRNQLFFVIFKFYNWISKHEKHFSRLQPQNEYFFASFIIWDVKSLNFVFSYIFQVEILILHSFYLLKKYHDHHPPFSVVFNFLLMIWAVLHGVSHFWGGVLKVFSFFIYLLEFFFGIPYLCFQSRRQRKIILL